MIIINNIKEQLENIHNEINIVDAHFDMLVHVLKKRNLGHKKVIERDFIPGFLEGGVNLVVASLFVDNQFLPEMGLRTALDQVSVLYEEIQESPDKLMLCKSYKDIEEAINKNKIGIVLSLEGADPIGNDLKLLRVFYELGVRMVGLVWSRRNYAADGCDFNDIKGETKGGLTDFGIELIEEAEKLGMIIDVSHLNDKGFWDVMKISKKPVIASHSNSRKIATSIRNLTDDQIKAIAKTGGVLGMNGYSDFVSDKEEERDVKGLVKHVRHIVDLVGVMHVGLGFDFCDLIFSDDAESLTGKKETFDVIKGHENINQFTKALMEEGFAEEELQLILGGNFLRLYKDSF